MKSYHAIGLAFTLAAISGAPVLAAPLPGGASTLQETYQDWTVSCQNQKETSVCVMRQDQSSTQTGQRVLTAELRNVAGGKVEGVLLMPFGLDLAKGAALKIDDVAGQIWPSPPACRKVASLQSALMPSRLQLSRLAPTSMSPRRH